MLQGERHSLRSGCRGLAFASFAVIVGEELHRVGGERFRIGDALLRHLDDAFCDYFARRAGISRPRKAAAGFFNPIPGIVKGCCKQPNCFRIEYRLRLKIF